MVKRLYGYNNLPLIKLNIDFIDIAMLLNLICVKLHGSFRRSIAKSSRVVNVN